MRGGKSLLFRALAAREPKRFPTILVAASQRRPLMSGIVRSRVSRRCPHNSAVQRFARALKARPRARVNPRVWVQRDINRTRAVAHVVRDTI